MINLKIIQAAYAAQYQKNKKLSQKWTEHRNRHFFKGDIHMANKQIQICSPLLSIREMQIILTVSYHLTPVIMAIIKTPINNKHWKGCGEKGTILHCWWECKLIQSLWRTVWLFLKNLG